MSIFDIFKKKNKEPVDETLSQKDMTNNHLSLIDLYRQAANGEFKFKYFGDSFSHDDFGIVDVDHWFLFKDGKLIAKYQNTPLIKSGKQSKFDGRTHYYVISREVDKKGREKFSYNKFHFDIAGNYGAHWNEEVIVFSNPFNVVTVDNPDKIPEDIKVFCDLAKDIDKEIEASRNKNNVQNDEKKEPTPIEKPVEQRNVNLDGREK